MALPTEEPAPLTVRRAVAHDGPELARLRRQMFEAMGQPPVDGDAWEAATASVFTRALEGDGPSTDDGWRPGFVGFVVERPDGPGLVGSAVAELMDRLPGPGGPHSRWAYLSSVSVDPPFRRRGIARALMERLVDEVQARGANRIDLHATPEGRPLYESMGFVLRARNPEMRLAR